ncbi:MAG: nicotinate (nicotinamide) nucleotide adenylyltransferase [Tissierellia bacterium]|nr:nicotinate (nicotinamide) nucleotide adenylyltransferase [Tissierellia bacterium]
MKIALFGGTFDPIHLGHLIVLENSINELDLDKIILLPTANAPHKLNNKKTDIETRIKMCFEAVKDNDKLLISSYESQKEVSYTFETLDYFKRQFPNDDIYYIMGEDSFLNIETWKQYKKILYENNIIVFSRYFNYTTNPSLIEKLNEYRNNGAKIFFLDNVSTTISSTLIRQLVKSKKSIKYLVTSEVENIIKERRLYVD